MFSLFNDTVGVVSEVVLAMRGRDLSDSIGYEYDKAQMACEIKTALYHTCRILAVAHTAFALLSTAIPHVHITFACAYLLASIFIRESMNLTFWGYLKQL